MPQPSSPSSSITVAESTDEDLLGPMPGFESKPKASSTGPIKSPLAKDEGFRDLVEEYVAAIPGITRKIQTALDAGDLATVAGLSHQLKGSAGMYGFGVITDAARVVEEGAKAKESVEKLTEAIKVLSELCSRATAEP
jgi:HPt (histidine-containing phosphotransfer) domain-containing protein